MDTPFLKYSFQPIGRVHSCFKEKFGIPRQPGLASDARAFIKMIPPFDQMEAFRGLESFSHIWVVFVFHACLERPWKSTVRPPRLGGNRRMGVFSTRSGFRPNPIGLSAVQLEKIVREKKETCLYLKGIDFLDGTPVLDIKPYLPYADCIPQSTGGFAKDIPLSSFQVLFSPDAETFCLEKEHNRYPGLRQLIEQLLKLDPRPAYYDYTPQKRQFGMKVYDVDVKWLLDGNTIYITTCSDESTP